MFLSFDGQFPRERQIFQPLAALDAAPKLDSYCSLRARRRLRRNLRRFG